MAAKGQVSLFIVVGIIAVLMIGGIMFNTTETRLDDAALRAAVPDNGQPVYDYISECLEQVGESAVLRIGERGGYIDGGFRVDREPTQGEAVQFSPNSDFNIPYWYHMESDNACRAGCSFTEQIPSLTGFGDSIENQIEEVVEEEIETCLAGFRPFTEEGWRVSTLTDPQVDASINEDDVGLILQYPVEMVRGDEELALDEYGVKLLVDLKDAYELGVELVTLEQEYQYLEKGLYQLISLSQGRSTDKLPPEYDVEVTTKSSVMWIESDVADSVQDLITAYTPLLQVFGVDNYRYVRAPVGVGDTELFEQLHNRNMLVIPENVYEGLEAKHIYIPWWEPYFDLNCQGELCRSDDMMSTTIIPMGIHRYQFSYDVSYPVLVQLKDPDAFNGRGFTMQFMLESNIRSSQPVTRESVDLSVEPEAQSLFCNPNQARGSTINISLFDASTEEPIEDAVVIFSCGEQQLVDSCSLGELGNGDSVQLPKCIGGRLSFNKEDYAPVSVPLDTDQEVVRELVLSMEPYREIDFDLRRFVLEREFFGWQVNPNLKSLHPEEQAIVTLNRIGNEGEEGFSAYANIFGSKPLNEKQGQFENIRMLPGTYEVEITTILTPSEPIRIMPQPRKYKKGLFSKGSFLIPPEPIEFNYSNPLPYGGAQFTFTVTGEDLDNYNVLQFRTIDFALDRVPEPARVIEDLEHMGDVESKSAIYRQWIEPEWRR